MKFFFTLQQKCRTGNLDSNLISRQYKLDLMADFMRNKYENPKLRQSKIANQLGYSSSTLERYRNNIITLLLYTIQPNNTNKRTKKTSNTNFDNISHREHDLKRPQMTSNDLKMTSKNVNENGKKVKTKNHLKSGSLHEKC